MMTKDERIRFYKSKEWQTTRKRVLERDNYECQQCKRDGKLTTYDKSKRKSLDVDHILSLEHHPEFAHDLNNLETLCIKCHNKRKEIYKKKINGKTKNGKYPRVKKSKAIKILGERAGARLRDNFKNPCITPLL